MYNSKVRNIELPENLFSNLGETKSKTLIQKKKILEENDNLNSFKEDYLKENNTKLMNFTKQKEYRDRIDKMYENIKSITPIDNEIDNVLYFNNYQEKGIVVKPKVVSLKQFWTEYRLINNEKHFSSVNKNNIGISKKLSDFDKLFDALQSRVTEINSYIDELKEMRTTIDKSSDKLEKDKEKLSQEKQKFFDYKMNEESKIKKEKENLKINYDRLQTIIDDLDKKLGSINQ